MVAKPNINLCFEDIMNSRNNKVYFVFVVQSSWLEYTPQWCGSSGNRTPIKSGVTEQECKKLCADCAAIEFWSGGGGDCYRCLDHTKRTSYTNIGDLTYPPHVFVRPWV